jgi:hypothetical protein
MMLFGLLSMGLDRLRSLKKQSASDKISSVRESKAPPVS